MKRSQFVIQARALVIYCSLYSSDVTSRDSDYWLYISITCHMYVWHYKVPLQSLEITALQKSDVTSNDSDVNVQWHNLVCDYIIE